MMLTLISKIGIVMKMKIMMMMMMMMMMITRDK